MMIPRTDVLFFDRSDGDISRDHLRNLRARDICSPSGESSGPTCSVELSVALPYMRGHAWRVRAGNVAGWSPWTRNTFGMVSAALVPDVPARSDVPLGDRVDPAGQMRPVARIRVRPAV